MVYEIGFTLPEFLEFVWMENGVFELERNKMIMIKMDHFSQLNNMNQTVVCEPTEN